MLMTVLKGPLAVKQSKALIRTFKKMKDYILENRDLIGQREILQLSMETANNRIEINKINSDMISLEKQISDVAEGLKDVVTKSELADMMNSFVSDDDKWLILTHVADVISSIQRKRKDRRCVSDTGGLFASKYEITDSDAPRGSQHRPAPELLPDQWYPEIPHQWWKQPAGSSDAVHFSGYNRLPDCKFLR